MSWFSKKSKKNKENQSEHDVESLATETNILGGISAEHHDNSPLYGSEYYDSSQQNFSDDSSQMSVSPDLDNRAINNKTSVQTIATHNISNQNSISNDNNVSFGDSNISTYNPAEPIPSAIGGAGNNANFGFIHQQPLVVENESNTSHNINNQPSYNNFNVAPEPNIPSDMSGQNVPASPSQMESQNYGSKHHDLSHSTEELKEDDMATYNSFSSFQNNDESSNAQAIEPEQPIIQPIINNPDNNSMSSETKQDQQLSSDSNDLSPSSDTSDTSDISDVNESFSFTTIGAGASPSSDQDVRANEQAQNHNVETDTPETNINELQSKEQDKAQEHDDDSNPKSMAEDNFMSFGFTPPSSELEEKKSEKTELTNNKDNDQNKENIDNIDNIDKPEQSHDSSSDVKEDDEASITKPNPFAEDSADIEDSDEKTNSDHHQKDKEDIKSEQENTDENSNGDNDKKLSFAGNSPFEFSNQDEEQDSSSSKNDFMSSPFSANPFASFGNNSDDSNSDNSNNNFDDNNSDETKLNSNPFAPSFAGNDVEQEDSEQSSSNSPDLLSAPFISSETNDTTDDTTEEKALIEPKDNNNDESKNKEDSSSKTNITQSESLEEIINKDDSPEISSGDISLDLADAQDDTVDMDDKKIQEDKLLIRDQSEDLPPLLMSNPFDANSQEAEKETEEISEEQDENKNIQDSNSDKLDKYSPKDEISTQENNLMASESIISEDEKQDNIVSDDIASQKAVIVDNNDSITDNAAISSNNASSQASGENDHSAEETLIAIDEKNEEDNNTDGFSGKLIRMGLVSEDQLIIAKQEQKKSGKMLGQILVEMGFLTDSACAEVLAESTGSERFDAKGAVLDPILVRKIPKEIATRNKMIAVVLEGNKLQLAMSDVYNVIAIDQVRRYFESNIQIIPVFCMENEVLEMIDQYYDYDTSIDGILKEIETGIRENKADIDGESESYINPTVRLVDALLVDAIKTGASDIHFNPEGSFLRLRYRIDGKLKQVRVLHISYWPAIVVRIKIMSGMNIAESRKPQDGRISYHVMGREVDFRVATQPTIHGENIVMRLLDKRKALMPMQKLGYSERNQGLIKKLLLRPEGIIIVTGPTGSGKTTSLYSMLQHINNIDTNIMTLEDPVEYQLPLIRQTNIRDGAGVTFSGGIKSLMRQDPNIIFLGEVRDEDTALMAVRAALTGHQVFTTLHTNDALGAIPRLVDIGIPHHLLAGSLIGIFAQRLARKLCDHCKQEKLATPEEARILGFEPDEAPYIYEHKGCEKCNHTGYKGRTAIIEILPIDKGMDELIATGATRNELYEYALESGFIPMPEDGIDKVITGEMDIAELIRTIDMTERL